MITLSELHIYPIKSCAGIRLSEAKLGPLGLELDRRWMLIGRDGVFLSQRDHPLMATITPAVQGANLIVQAPAMPEHCLSLQPSATAASLAASLWNDHLPALDAGEEAHRWFSSYLGTDARLVQFDPAVSRISSQKWTGATTAPLQFADAFPLLVTSEASLQELNRRMQQKGAPTLSMDRFRPNLVLSGLEAYEEDYIDTLTLGEPGREVVLQLVKPCARCPIPGIDQRTGLRDAQWPNEPLDTLALYRANARIDGGLAFGQNAIVLSGFGNLLRPGQSVRAELKF
jgi:uncharacterized protein